MVAAAIANLKDGRPQLIDNAGKKTPPIGGVSTPKAAKMMNVGRATLAAVDLGCIRLHGVLSFKGRTERSLHLRPAPTPATEEAMANAVALVARPHPSAIPFCIQLTGRCSAICRELAFDEGPHVGGHYAVRLLDGRLAVVVWEPGMREAVLGKVTAVAVTI